MSMSSVNFAYVHSAVWSIQITKTDLQTLYLYLLFDFIGLFQRFCKRVFILKDHKMVKRSRH